MPKTSTGKKSQTFTQLKKRFNTIIANEEKLQTALAKTIEEFTRVASEIPDNQTEAKDSTLKAQRLLKSIDSKVSTLAKTHIELLEQLKESEEAGSISTEVKEKHLQQTLEVELGLSNMQRSHQIVMNFGRQILNIVRHPSTLNLETKLKPKPITIESSARIREAYKDLGQQENIVSVEMTFKEFKEKFKAFEHQLDLDIFKNETEKFSKIGLTALKKLAPWPEASEQIDSCIKQLDSEELSQDQKFTIQSIREVTNFSLRDDLEQHKISEHNESLENMELKRQSILDKFKLLEKRHNDYLLLKKQMSEHDKHNDVKLFLLNQATTEKIEFVKIAIEIEEILNQDNNAPAKTNLRQKILEDYKSSRRKIARPDLKSDKDTIKNLKEGLTLLENSTNDGDIVKEAIYQKKKALLAAYETKKQHSLESKLLKNSLPFLEIDSNKKMDEKEIKKQVHKRYKAEMSRYKPTTREKLSHVKRLIKKSLGFSGHGIS